MKYLLMTLAIVMLFVGPALAADHGNLSQSQMAKLGLSGMTQMSDSQGTAVRGMGCCFPVIAVGISSAKAGCASACDTQIALGQCSASVGNLAKASCFGCCALATGFSCAK